MTAPVSVSVRALVLVAAGCAALAQGCAAAPSTRPTPQSARGELDMLSRRVATLSAEWRFTAPPPAELATAPVRSPRCQTMAAAADEICRASARICVLAEALGDADAARACQSSRAACARALVHGQRCRSL